MPRNAALERKTKETSVSVVVDLDVAEPPANATGIAFFDHMLDQLGTHGGFTLSVKAEGDLDVDDHHTVEDCGIVLGQAFAQALGAKTGLARFADRTIPLDEALVAVSLDLSGRPFLVYDLDLPTDRIGSFDGQLMEEFWRAFVMAAAVTLHVRKISGRNSHHIVEASVKAIARAIRDAIAVVDNVLPSTKGAL
ncbi:MAG: imidazoleglycerol-phosphate dehydratase HisB [Acidimicrobiia bacterium]|jgi:imidazoleglycerol-phosphate dehydratase|nr:imidazoleglycerol-phosphate dehydratase HisB [Acidimicrobiia bacterium]MBP8180041.1 imidazoleglycerol-phosphate dehydratase HisB [Acidimicrobiia bacterium]